MPDQDDSHSIHVAKFVLWARSLASAKRVVSYLTPENLTWVDSAAKEIALLHEQNRLRSAEASRKGKLGGRPRRTDLAPEPAQNQRKKKRAE
jgi:hypothetical protein